MTVEIVDIPEIPLDSQQQDRRYIGQRERLCAKSIHSAVSAGAIFHKIKPPLFRGTHCFIAVTYGVL